MEVEGRKEKPVLDNSILYFETLKILKEHSIKRGINIETKLDG